MNQAEVARLISGLRIRVPLRTPKLPGPEGYRGTLYKVRELVAALVANERLEVSPTKGELTRLYTERLIAEAVQHGDRHRETMEVAKWWLKKDTAAVHKLFKVLAPRFQDYSTSYTRLFFSPYQTDDNPLVAPYKVVVELKGHPFPRLEYSNTVPNRNHIHNVLLSEAKKDGRLRRTVFRQPSSKADGEVD